MKILLLLIASIFIEVHLQFYNLEKNSRLYNFQGAQDFFKFQTLAKNGIGILD